MLLDCMADLQAKLKQAEQAYHNLMTGQSARVFVDQNGERIEYTAINARNLQAYINTLKSQIASGGCGLPVTRPIGFLF